MERFLHPDLTQKVLFDKLFDHWRKDKLYVQCMHQILAGDCFCTLRTYLRIVDTQGTTVVRANPRKVHNKNIRHALQESSGNFSFVRVVNDGLRCLCQVMAIVGCDKSIIPTSKKNGCVEFLYQTVEKKEDLAMFQFSIRYQ